MAEEKLDKQWKNPCKYCLVKPACINRCKLLKNHIDLFGIWASLSTSIGAFIIMIGIIVVCYFHYSKPITITITSLYVISMYCYMFWHHRKNPTELTEMKFLERLFIISLFPWLMPAVGVWILVENRIDESGYLFRYHKSLDPYINVRKERINAKLRREMGQS